MYYLHLKYAENVLFLKSLCLQSWDMIIRKHVNTLFSFKIQTFLASFSSTVFYSSCRLYWSYSSGSKNLMRCHRVRWILTAHSQSIELFPDSCHCAALIKLIYLWFICLLSFIFVNLQINRTTLILCSTLFFAISHEKW